MWKPSSAKNLHLNNYRFAKKGSNQGRSLRLETLESRTMFYADPLTLSVPDSPVLVGEAKPVGPTPHLFLQPQAGKPTSPTKPSQIDLDVHKTHQLKSTRLPTMGTCFHSEDPHHRIAMCRHLSEFSLTGQFALFTQK